MYWSQQQHHPSLLHSSVLFIHARSCLQIKFRYDLTFISFLHYGLTQLRSIILSDNSRSTLSAVPTRSLSVCQLSCVCMMNEPKGSGKTESFQIKCHPTCIMVGRDSSVGIATRYGLDGPGIESRWGRVFPHPSRPALGAHPASCTMGTGSFPGVRRPGRGAHHPPPSKCRGHEKVELYLYSPSGPQWPVIGRTPA